ncbi:MAG: hypothetical protein ABSC94_15660 [Polyangiaceae bacterium]
MGHEKILALDTREVTSPPVRELPLSPAIGDLHLKYTEMLAMRSAHADGSEDRSRVRQRMLALATRFPGALRELDQLETEDIRHRIVALARVQEGQSDIEPWMTAIGHFHSLARGALSVKRWLSANRSVDADAEHRFAIELDKLPFADEARVWKDDLAALAKPPGGKVTQLVFRRLAVLLGTTPAQARRLVFGEARRRVSL